MITCQQVQISLFWIKTKKTNTYLVNPNCTHLCLSAVKDTETTLKLNSKVAVLLIQKHHHHHRKHNNSRKIRSSSLYPHHKTSKTAATMKQPVVKRKYMMRKCGRRKGSSADSQKTNVDWYAACEKQIGLQVKMSRVEFLKSHLLCGNFLGTSNEEQSFGRFMAK